MSPLTDVTKFTLRVVKALVASPRNPWENSYEFVSEGPVSLGELTALASTVGLFETTIHLSTVRFDRVLVSTWTADSHPYNPEVFLTLPMTSVGAIGAGSDTLGLNTCLRVVRAPATGRFGHLFYRACLTEVSINAPAGITVLSDISGTDGVLQAAIASSGLDGYFGSEAAGPLKMAMINSDGTQVRPIITIAAQGVTTLPTDHKWFNRPSSPTPP